MHSRSDPLAQPSSKTSSNTSPNTSFSSKSLGLNSLFVSLALLIMGTGLQITFLALRANEMGVSKTVIGLIGSSYFLGYLLGCRNAYKFVQGVAHIRTFAGLSAFCVSICLSYTLFENPFYWMVGRFLTGFCMAGLYIVVESWVNQQAQNSHRGKVISSYRLVDIGASLGAQSLLLFGPFEMKSLFTLFAVFLALSIIPITLTPTIVPECLGANRMTLKSAFEKVPFSLIGCLLLGLLNSSLWSLSPVFMAQYFTESWAVPGFSMLYLVGGFFSQKSIAQFSDRRDRRVVIIGCAILTSVSVLLLPSLVQWSRGLFWLTVLFYGCVSVPIYSLFIALAHDQSGASEYVPVSSALLFAYGFGAVQGPFIAGFLSDLFGISSLFYYIGTGFSLFVVYGIYRLQVRRRVWSNPHNLLSLPSEKSPLVIKVDDEVKDTNTKGVSSF